jgi:2-keto-4-pentenoate hydratase
MAAQDALLDWLENEFYGKPTGGDAIKQAPELTNEQAYRLRQELVKRRVAKGDAHIGYKIAGGWSGVVAEKEEPRGEPVVGPLMRSGLVAHGGTFAYAGAARVFVEAEVAVMLRHDLKGPATLPQVLAAVDGYFAGIEIVPAGSGPRASSQHRILGSKFTGGVVVGSQLTPARGLDISLEGAMISINGVPRAAATAMNVMGSPLIAMQEVANRLAVYGEYLKAGMIVITGTITGTTDVRPGDLVEASFTRLGKASVRITD